MAETTTYQDDVTRDEAAELVEELAAELRGTGPAQVQVGNKLLTLTPASTVEYDIEVEERSPMLRGDREEITVTIGWAVPKGDADAEDGGEVE
ncbi:amphi-Trp domain-containing protein [Halopiger thermotolerans]